MTSVENEFGVLLFYKLVGLAGCVQTGPKIFSATRNSVDLRPLISVLCKGFTSVPNPRNNTNAAEGIPSSCVSWNHCEVTASSEALKMLFGFDLILSNSQDLLPA